MGLSRGVTGDVWIRLAIYRVQCNTLSTSWPADRVAPPSIHPSSLPIRPMNYAAFLRHKVKLVAEHAGPDLLPADRAKLVPQYEKGIAILLERKSPVNHWKDVEHDLNVMMRATVDAKKRKLIDAE